MIEAQEPAGVVPDFRRLATARRAIDALTGQIHVTIAGVSYILPVLKSGPNGRWLAKMDAETRVILAAVQQDPGTGSDVTAQLVSPEIMPKVRAALHEYDWMHALPPESELAEQITDIEYVTALLEVWAAANPLVVIALDTIVGILTLPSSQPTNTRQRPTGGRRRSSRKN